MSARTCDACTHRKVCRLWATFAQAVVDVSATIPAGDLRREISAGVAKHCPHFEARSPEE